MAELIDKKAITESRDILDSLELFELTPYISAENLIKFVDGLPTTTEAEIRNKSIDEVMTRARELQEEQIKGLEYSSMRGGKQWAIYMNTHLGHIQTACRKLLAEQLKGE